MGVCECRSVGVSLCACGFVGVCVYMYVWDMHVFCLQVKSTDGCFIEPQ